ncbi:MAG: RluA family pseudouridine synthase [Hyphomicrobiaceae bacterium]|nr:MAG: RluA family pseudouridine synthase [Hyphomicrobiaceae bacterium]
MARHETRKPRRGATDGARPARRDMVGTRPAAKSSVAPLTGAQTLTVKGDEAGMRLDRFLSARFPELPFSLQQRIIRKGEVRVDGGRKKPESRLEAGQQVRVPPIRHDRQPPGPRKDADPKVIAELEAMTLYEDDDVLVLNKPYGLAVQGGSGTVRHVDGMLWALADKKGDRPRLVHRLDKDTAGCLLIAKSRFAAGALAKSFRSRETRKIYWALVAGVPKLKQGRVSTFLAKDEEAEREGEARMRVAEHGEEGASHALTYYAVVDNAGRIASWVSLKPVTGRTHQLRAHMNHIGHPIVGDPKYFDRESWELPAGIQNRLHLLARRIVVPHPRTGEPIDVTAPLPQHMRQSWSLLGFDTGADDPILAAPEG